MTESRHTPGPWNYGGVTHASHSGGQSIDFSDGSGFLLAVSEADARLIAAAPETKDALRKLVNEVTGLAGFGPEIKALIGVTNWNVLERRVQEAHAAIAKAEGKA